MVKKYARKQSASTGASEKSGPAVETAGQHPESSEPPVQPHASPPEWEAQSVETRKPHAGPSEADIRLRAYHRYLERGRTHGRHVDDWIEAEKELLKK